MAIANTTQYANRYGLNIKIYDYSDKTSVLAMVDFANLSEISVGGDRTWATGGQNHTNRIGFNNPIEGTLKISTQIMTAQLLQIMAGKIPTNETGVTFENTVNAMPKYFYIEAETVWQDAAGNTYSEDLTFHKACPKRAFNIQYTGEGDPTSMDIEFDLMEDDDHKVLTIMKADSASSGTDEG